MATNVLTLYLQQAADLVVSLSTTISGGVSAWTVRWRARSSLDGSVLLEKSTGSGIVVNSDDQSWTISILHADLNAPNFVAGNYLYDFWRIDSGAEAPIIPNTRLQTLQSVNYG